MPDPEDDPLATEPFSRDYLLVEGARVYAWRGDLAVMDHDLYRGLATKVGEPLVGRVGGLTYEFIPSRNVPAESVNVPKRQHNGATPDTLLIQK